MSATRFSVPDKFNVKKPRESLGLSQPEFAVRFGFSLATVRQWEQGRRQPEGLALASQPYTSLAHRNVLLLCR